MSKRTCSVCIDSAVDEVATRYGYTPKFTSRGECTQVATKVVADDGEEFDAEAYSNDPSMYDLEDYSYVCTRHAQIWIDHLNGALVEDLDPTPVSQADIDAAISSILEVLR